LSQFFATRYDFKQLVEIKITRSALHEREKLPSAINMNVPSLTNNAITVSFDVLNETSNRLRQAGAIFFVKKAGKGRYQIILKKPPVADVSELLDKS
jgi:hypothetical protein